MSEEEVWIKAQEAQQILGVHLNTLYRWCREKRIPCQRIGSQWRFKRRDLLEFSDTDL